MKKRFKYFLILFSTIIFNNILSAEHIVSGVMYYQCVGKGSAPNTNTYEFTLRLFTDCNIVMNFENSVEIGIYKGTPGNYQYDRKENAFLSSNPETANFNGSCATLLNNICVGVATYTFRVDDLPIISENYLIAYQRCCRNMTISNILDPGRTGSTIMMELTPESQRPCNSSPKFDKTPQLIACVNEDLVMDLKGIDSENDMITYELCSPLSGGGPRGMSGVGGNPQECLGISPNPATCVPPLEEIKYSTGVYTALSPFPSSVPITLVDGVLKARPSMLGQYIFGVCVKEYRGGLLMSVQRRDIQINFAQCNITIKAAIKAISIQNGLAIVSNCDPAAPFKIINESMDTSYIKKVYWEFNSPKGLKITDSAFHFSKILNDTGTYLGKLIINRGNNCSDSLNIQITNGSKPFFDLNPIYDSCSLNPIEFSTPIRADAPIFYKIDYGDGITEESLPKLKFSHTYSKPGVYQLHVIGSNASQCTIDITKAIRLFPTPTNPTLKFLDSILCYPGNFKLALNELADSSYTYAWVLSDGRKFSGPTPSVPVTGPGNFTVSLTVSSPSGCKSVINFTQNFSGVEKPIANFSVVDNNLTIRNPLLELINTSQKADEYKWDFGDNIFSSLQNTNHTYTRPGKFIVKLVVTNILGCRDSTSQIIMVGDLSDVFVPNVFTPNGDGVNDVFSPSGLLNLSNYELSIFNRWGDLVFISLDPDIGWEGRNQSSQSLPIGVYVYQIKFSLVDQATKVVKGSVTLIR